VQDMLAGSQEGTPFEIVAAQAMLARWAGIPARIGYGFDGGDEIGASVLSVRPRHGASWLEVYFPEWGWFPVIGSPLQAKASLSTEGPTNPANIEPARNVATEVWIPLRLEQGSQLYQQVQRWLAVAMLLALIVALVYVSFPAAWKASRRSRRRAWAAEAGAVARIEVAYAGFRDLCTDLGLGGDHRTPLGFLEGFVDDEEHTELAWLVTRALYGDMRDEVSDDDAAACEELVRTLRARLVQTQPFTLRFVAAISRLSMHRPYAPDVVPPARKEARRARAAA